MTSTFEREVQSTASASFEAAFVSATAHEEWTTSPNPSEGSLPCTSLPEGTTIRVNPMNRQYNGWNEAHFHTNLRLPMECSIAKGLVVTLEASARECVAVALSPKDYFDLGKTYAIHFGAAGNTSTVIRRRLISGHEAVDVAFPGRVCSDQKWVSYWICLLAGRIYAGLGKQPGQKCVGCLDDTLYHQLRSGMDAVRFVGLGNSVLGKSATALKVRNVCVCSVPEYLVQVLDQLPLELPIINVDVVDSGELQKLMEGYQRECLKAKKRAEKFGIPYKAPPPQAFFLWSDARKIRANPQKGFITGMDVMSHEELEKKKARAARFGAQKREIDDDEKTEVTEEDVMEEEALPVHEAWDNEELVQEHRWDPPTSLWMVPSENQDEADEAKEEYSMEVTTKPKQMPEKVHICSIDWAAFKQIRTDDMMAHFSIYGPSYIEWLGELSCNILFEDKFSAARALNGMSQELPSPAPEELNRPSTTDGQGAYTAPDFGNMGWRFCLKPIRKVTKDRFGRVGTRARILMRIANSTDVLVEKPSTFPKPPPGFTTKRVLGPGDDFVHRNKRQRRMPEDDEEMNQEHPDLTRGLRSGRDGYSVEDLRAERSLPSHGDATYEVRNDSETVTFDDIFPWDEEPNIAEA